MHQCGVAFNSSPRGQKAVFVKNTPSSKVVPEGWAVTATAQPSRTTLPSSVSIGLTQNKVQM